jgi:stage II sporulation protein D
LLAVVLAVLAIPAAVIGLRLARGGGAFQPASGVDVRLSLGPGQPVLRLPLETYVEGVVASEVPARFALAALQAQAVAARTYAVQHLRSLGGAGCPWDDRADVCAGSEGQAWSDEGRLRAVWGPNYARNRRRVERAVRSTAGLILVYGGRPADAVYFAASGGMTEDARYVWGRAVPYLVQRPVPFEPPTPYDARTTVFTRADLARRLGVDPASLGDLELRDVRRDPSGRVLQARLGGQALGGPELRRRLELPSTWIVAWRAQGDRVAVTTRGYGHGVGLSQWGAEGMARQGADYRAILAYFYPGTQLRPLGALMGQLRRGAT